MKKILVLLVTLVLLTGCVSIQNADIDTIINETISTKYNNLYNHVGKGYKYYAPRGVTRTYSNDYNEEEQYLLENS